MPSIIPVRRVLLRAPAVVVSGGGYAAETQAWADEVALAGGTVSPTRMGYVDTFIVALKAAGLWATLDRYWLLAGEDTQSASIDMKNLEALTIVNAPTFNANVGYTTTPGHYLQTNFNPDGVTSEYEQDTATVGIFNNVATTANAFLVGVSNGAFDQITQINPAAYGVGPYSGSWKLNTSSDAVTGNTLASTRGALLITRKASNNVAPIYFNGAFLDTLTSTTTGLPGFGFPIGAITQGGGAVAWGAGQFSDFVAGSGWDSTQVAAFYAAQAALLTSIGVLP